MFAINTKGYKANRMIGFVLMGKGRVTMPDRENVIKGCELLKDFLGDGLPGKNVVFNSYINIVNDAIDLLKEQDNMISIKDVSDYLAEYALPPTLQKQNLFSFNGNMASEWEQFLRDLKGR
jgi:hypothetical protein